MSLLSLEKVDKIFGGLRALKEVSLEVPKGAIFGLIGPGFSVRILTIAFTKDEHSFLGGSVVPDYVLDVPSFLLQCTCQ